MSPVILCIILGLMMPLGVAFALLDKKIAKEHDITFFEWVFKKRK